MDKFLKFKHQLLVAAYSKVKTIKNARSYKIKSQWNLFQVNSASTADCIGTVSACFATLLACSKIVLSNFCVCPTFPPLSTVYDPNCDTFHLI